MTSLGETYQGRDGVKKRPRRLYLGVGLFLAGSLLVVVGILAGTTDLFSAVGLDKWGSLDIHPAFKGEDSHRQSHNKGGCVGSLRFAHRRGAGSATEPLLLSTVLLTRPRAQQSIRRYLVV
ncbi:DUF7139 domain-containing protein [Haladaptatus sp. DFWS20]|uniref:DUF7139 domain-containing protein n=1 Tax=Haladaptatus sp. DFWS20 TaxID=3403467 RepID=UPI003EB9983F